MREAFKKQAAPDAHFETTYYQRFAATADDLLRAFAIDLFGAGFELRYPMGRFRAVHGSKASF